MSGDLPCHRTSRSLIAFSSRPSSQGRISSSVTLGGLSTSSPKTAASVWFVRSASATMICRPWFRARPITGRQPSFPGGLVPRRRQRASFPQHLLPVHAPPQPRHHHVWPSIFPLGLAGVDWLGDANLPFVRVCAERAQSFLHSRARRRGTRIRGNGGNGGSAGLASSRPPWIWRVRGGQGDGRHDRGMGEGRR